MNYRHAFHAGNHGDVLKHVNLTRIFEHMKLKDKGFAFVDAHAGAGTYDLMGVEAAKTFEWQGGVGKMQAPFAPDIEALLAPYRSVLGQVNPRGGLRYYPGSPQLALQLLRKQDRLVLNELHPETKTLVEHQFKPDKRVRVLGLDATEAVASVLPVTERRAVVLADPAYEVVDEAERVFALLKKGLARMAGATFVVWYPVKTRTQADAFVDLIASLNVPGMLHAELLVREPFADGGLAGSGLIIVNPPWMLHDELSILMPALAGRLGIGEWGRGVTRWITPPR